MTDSEKIIGFVTETINEKNKYTNAVVYEVATYDGAVHLKVAFHKNASENYWKLMQFCVDNHLIIVSTQPATFATVIRCKSNNIDGMAQVIPFSYK